MREGDAIPTVERLITQDGIERYAEASGDFNPIHVDPDFAAKSQFGRTIAHGMMVAATLNRTLKALALAKFGAEYVLGWLPRGTHNWRKFVRPSEFVRGLRPHGVEVVELKGVSYSPLANAWALSRDLDVNYLVFAVKEEE